MDKEKAHGEGTSKCCFTSDDASFLTSSYDGFVHLWDCSDTSKPKQTYNHKELEKNEVKILHTLITLLIQKNRFEMRPYKD